MILSKKIKRRLEARTNQELKYILLVIQIRGDRRGRGRLNRRVGRDSEKPTGKFNRDHPNKRKPINRDRKGSRDNEDRPRNKFNRFNDRNDKNRDRPRKSETKREPESK